MDDKIKLAIVGSRTFNDYNKLSESIRQNFDVNNIECIVSGGARGADSLGAQFARDNNIELVEHKADWKKFGKSAGFIRNHDIIKSCTDCIAFWDGQSHGTKHDIELCEQYEKKCVIILF